MTAVRPGQVAVLRCWPQCVSCGRKHYREFTAQPADRLEGTPENLAIKVRIRSELGALVCTCGLTLDEAVAVQRRRAAGTLS